MQQDLHVLRCKERSKNRDAINQLVQDCESRYHLAASVNTPLLIRILAVIAKIVGSTPAVPTEGLDTNGNGNAANGRGRGRAKAPKKTEPRGGTL